MAKENTERTHLDNEKIAIAAIRNYQSISQEKKEELIKTLFSTKARVWAREPKDLAPAQLEKVEKFLEFEKDTFKINSTWWQEIVRWWQKLKINKLGDIIEYLEWSAKWEQIFFDYKKFIQYVSVDKNCSPQEAEKKYMMTLRKFREKMKKIDEAGTYKDLYNNEIKGHGYLFAYERAISMGDTFGIWLANGHIALLTKDTWHTITHNKNFLASGRLLKD